MSDELPAHLRRLHAISEMVADWKASLALDAQEVPYTNQNKLLMLVAEELLDPACCRGGPQGGHAWSCRTLP